MDKRNQIYKSKRCLPFVFLFLIGLDQAAKFFSTNIYRNYNFAFSLPVPTVAMYLIYSLVVGAIVFYLAKNYFLLSLPALIGWTLILAGAVSNIGERVALGYVRDFIYILNGIFNLADAYIIMGILILILSNTNIRMLTNNTNNT